MEKFHKFAHRLVSDDQNDYIIQIPDSEVDTASADVDVSVYHSCRQYPKASYVITRVCRNSTERRIGLFNVGESQMGTGNKRDCRFGW